MKKQPEPYLDLNSINWQHPNIQDLVDLYDDEEDEFFKEFGIHFEDVCTKKEKI